MKDRKADIIDSTLEMFDKKGGDISARDISAAAGCSHTLIFNYFDSIDNLMGACFDEVCHRIKHNIQRVQFPDGYEDGKLEKYFLEVCDAYITYLQSHPVESHFYFAMLMKGYGYSKGYMLPSEILKLILGDKYNDVVKNNPEILFTAIYLISAINGVVQSLINAEFEGFDNIVPRLRQLVKEGVIGKHLLAEDSMIKAEL